MEAAAPELHGFGGRVRCIELPAFRESRGELIEFDHRHLPFAPQRTFLITDVPAGTVRGGHGHRTCEQLLVCPRGRVTVEIALGHARTRLRLGRPTLALYLGAGVWARQTYEEPETELLVFASLPYDPGSYIFEPGFGDTDWE